jgi:hypothetical protein
MARSGRSDGNGETPDYCQHCGEGVAPGHSYCPHCGGDLSQVGAREEPTTRATDSAPQSTERGVRAFGRRVNDYLSQGWHVESDAEDRVVLVNRTIGSLTAHTLLLVPTSGIGNLLYGWYEYAHNPDRLVLRADAPDYVPGRRARGRRTTSQQPDLTPGNRIERYLTSSLSRHVAGLLLFVGGLLLAVGSGLALAPSLFGLVALLLSLVVWPPTRRRIDDRHPPTAFGPTTSLEERYVTDTDRPCTVCRHRVDRGVVRDYRQEYAVAGIPLYTMETGENYYCESCHVAGEFPSEYLDVTGSDSLDVASDAIAPEETAGDERGTDPADASDALEREES